MSWTLDLADGAWVEVVETDGHHVVVRSSRPAPPGSILSAQTGLDVASTVRIKVHGCSRQPDGTFRIGGRWLDLTKAARAEIVERARNSG